MPNPTAMTEETLDALKGWPNPHAVDFTAKFADAISSRVPRGRVVHLNNSGKYELGCNNTTLNPMPLFLFQASDEEDVQGPGSNVPDPSTKKGAYVAINPTGKAQALPAAGAYELYSTEFVSATYNPNDKLTAANGTDPTTDQGKLQAGSIDTDVICGIVSRGKVDNGYGFDALAFWPVWFPKVT